MSGTTPATPPSDTLTEPQPIIALVVLAIVVLVIGIVAWRGSDELLNTTVSFVLGGAFVGVVQFYFGSAKGSQQKDATIASLATQKAPTP